MKLLKLSLLLGVLIFSAQSFGQCRGYARKKCRPQLDTYVHDGKMNVAMLYPGDKAEVLLTFYAGQEYRLLVCLDDFEDAHYVVYDKDKQELFNSKDSDKSHFDFKVVATQQLIVEVIIADYDNTTHEMDHIGCAAVMVGLKEKE